MPLTRKLTGAVTLVLLTAALSACNMPGQQIDATPVDVDAYSTSVAATVLASFTETAQAYSPTPEPSATETPLVSAATLAVSETPTSGPTLTFEPTLTAGACDNSTWVTDVSVPDGSQFPPSTEFVKTWRVRNTGGCTWNANYKVIYGYGDRMGGVSVSIGKEVKVGEEAEISITLRSPTVFGNYAGYWRLANDKGYPFGQFFSVIIAVPKP